MVFLASQILISHQQFDFQSAGHAFVKILHQLRPNLRESFACLFLSHQYNKQNHKIKKYLVETGAIEQTYNNMMIGLEEENTEEILMNLHLLILLT